MSSDIINRNDFSQSEMADNAYAYNKTPGSFEAVLELKVWAGRQVLRVFFTFEDGRQIIAPVYRWQRYLGFCEMPLGSKVRLTYTDSGHGIYLTQAEAL